jgi:hypothetical protein
LILPFNEKRGILVISSLSFLNGIMQVEGDEYIYRDTVETGNDLPLGGRALGVCRGDADAGSGARRIFIHTPLAKPDFVSGRLDAGCCNVCRVDTVSAFWQKINKRRIAFWSLPGLGTCRFWGRIRGMSAIRPGTLSKNHSYHE